MTDDKLKSALEGYRPELPDDFRFMASLERKLDAVEPLKRQARQMRRRGKVAVAVAAAAGFAMGALTVAVAPRIIGMASLARLGLAMDATADPRLLVCIAAAIVSALTAVNAYAIAQARLRQNL